MWTRCKISSTLKSLVSLVGQVVKVCSFETGLSSDSNAPLPVLSIRKSFKIKHCLFWWLWITKDFHKVSYCITKLRPDTWSSNRKDLCLLYLHEIDLILTFFFKGETLKLLIFFFLIKNPACNTTHLPCRGTKGIRQQLKLIYFCWLNAMWDVFAYKRIVEEMLVRTWLSTNSLSNKEPL